nr:outer membrane beta-barrel family protein [Hufsiella arboris]
MVTFIFLSYFLSNQTFAQKNSVNGKVIDTFGNEIEGATIYLLQLPDSVTVKLGVTNEKGNFIFSNLKVNVKYILSVRSLGFEKTTKGPFSFSSATTSVQTGNIFLLPSLQQLREVQVEERHMPIESKPGKIVLNVASSPLFSGSNAYEILQKAPATHVTENGISLNGKSVHVNIDGKSTYTSVSDLINFLQGLPASSVDAIDLVSNPSSNFDALGAGGIINIHLKKDQNVGTNFSVTAVGGFSNINSSFDPNYRDGAGFSINNRTKKLNVFASYNYNYSGQYRTGGVDRKSIYNNSLTAIDLAVINNVDRTGNTYRVGVDYYMNSKSTLGFNMGGFYNIFNFDKSNRSGFRSSTEIDSVIIGSGMQKRKLGNINFDANYHAVFDEIKGDLTISADYLKYKKTSNENIINQFINGDGISYRNNIDLINSAPVNYNIKAAAVDYIQPLGKKTKISGGLKTSLLNNRSSMALISVKSSSFVPNPDFTSSFRYREDIYAGYAMLSHSLKMLDLQFGVRVEKTISAGFYDNKDQVIDRNYTDFFPSLTATYASGEKANLTFSYNRRISRPDYEDLGVFIAYIDQYTYRAGNPYLNPEYTSNFDLSHFWPNKISASLKYSQGNDVLLNVLKQDDQSKTLTQIRSNIDKRYVYGLNVNMPLQLEQWWDLTLNFDGLYMKYIDHSTVDNYSNASPDVTVTALQNFRLKNNYSIDLFGSYETASVSGIFSFKPIYYLDIAFAKSFMNKNASLKLKVDDIFNTRKYKYASDYENLALSQFEKYDSRIATLSFSMLIGKSTIKSVKKPASGIDADQQKRLGQQ